MNGRDDSVLVQDIGDTSLKTWETVSVRGDARRCRSLIWSSRPCSSITRPLLRSTPAPLTATPSNPSGPVQHDAQSVAGEQSRRRHPRPHPTRPGRQNRCRDTACQRQNAPHRHRANPRPNPHNPAHPRPQRPHRGRHHRRTPPRAHHRPRPRLPALRDTPKMTNGRTHLQVRPSGMS